MRVLVLGGTLFLGRHIVDSALAGGHEVVLFNRGRTNPHLFPEVEKVRGDRTADVSKLRGRTFDAVLDPSGYRPEQVRTITDVLRGNIAHYTFVSSVSAYRAFAPKKPFDEEAPLAEGNQGYGALKARSEEALVQTLQSGGLARVRPGLIVGPHDQTDRFTYWPRRIARGGDVLAPGRPERPVQLLDVRDLAEWCVRLAERQHSGVFNAAGPGTTLTMTQLLEETVTETGSRARLVWIPDDRLLAAGVKPWSELPLWIPESDAESGGMLLADNRRAIAAGLTFRPLGDTIRDTLQWDHHRTIEPDRERRVTPITQEREAELLRHYG